MTYTALVGFVGVVGGVEVRFPAATAIAEDNAVEMGLADKPEIAEADIA